MTVMVIQKVLSSTNHRRGIKVQVSACRVKKNKASSMVLDDEGPEVIRSYLQAHSSITVEVRCSGVHCGDLMDATLSQCN